MAIASCAMGYMISMGWAYKAGFWTGGVYFILSILFDAFIMTPKENSLSQKSRS